jgi:phosphatidylserine/phosphatidylglycerophosphate/cardiolipin synthase-like enzyme
MRKRKKNSGVSVNAISGTHVVFLGFDTTPARRKSLMGFAIHRTDHTEHERYWLKGFRTFEATLPNPDPGTLVSTLEHPIQGYSWGDYTAKPDHEYTYKVVPLYGAPKNLEEGPAVSVTIETMSEDLGKQAIIFNRGVAGSQAYAREFGNVPPDKIKDLELRKAAYAWLSRGLEEAILKFIGQARNKDYGLRASVYEFSYAPVLDAFAKAHKNKADVKIVYDRRKKGPFIATERAAKTAGITGLMIRRETNSAISHNKFIVLLHKGKPIQVWTGSTNFTAGGIFGQSNVGHIIRDAKIAQQYLDYWTRLSADPEFKELRPANVAATPDPSGAPKKGSLTPLFSPRTDLKALQWYAERMDVARQFAGFTAAFGISATLQPVLLKKKDYLRFIMVENEGSKKVPKANPDNPNPKSQFQVFNAIRKIRNNRIAVGSIVKKHDDAVGSELHRWLNESLTGLNVHVKYLHTKYMFLDAMTSNPTVISGSANFSAASTTKNDENMVVIQGDTDVTDIFLGEFMRLFNHFQFRQYAGLHKALTRGERMDESPYLRTDDRWTDRFFDPGSVKFLERKMFA